jgi:hypothetical protein
MLSVIMLIVVMLSVAFFTLMLSVIMLSVVMLSVAFFTVMPSVIMLIVVMLSVVAPTRQRVNLPQKYLIGHLKLIKN